MPGKDVETMRNDAELILRAGLEAVKPRQSIFRYCECHGNVLTISGAAYNLDEYENIIVIGAGKAGASMASALEELLGDRLTRGFVTVKYGHLADLSKVTAHEAGHPVPDEQGLQGAEKIMELAKSAGANDLVVCLISGGGSALMPLPAEGVTLEQKQETTRILLACGATIHEINAVRKHISAVKGGRLAGAVYPATLVSLILSDVVGDDLDTIASGPTVPDSTTFQQCLDIFDKYGIQDKVPRPALEHIQKGVRGMIPETPKPGDVIFTKSRDVIVGSNWDCVSKARERAVELGYNTLVLSTMIEGETQDVANVHAGIAKEALKTGNPVGAPACILSGGETTVTIRGEGKGGRNTEFVLASAIHLAGWSSVVVLSAGTDGTDGPTDAAGARADGSTLARADSLGLDAKRYLRNNDSYTFFDKLDDLIKTGPTNTNVMDLRILLINKKQGE